MRATLNDTGMLRLGMSRDERSPRFAAISVTRTRATREGSGGARNHGERHRPANKPILFGPAELHDFKPKTW